MTVSHVTANPRFIPIIADSQERPGGAEIGTWPKRFAARALRLVVKAIRETQLRRAIRDLQRLDDRLLHDIGLSRSGIEQAIRYERERDLAQVRARFYGPAL